MQITSVNEYRINPVAHSRSSFSHGYSRRGEDRCSSTLETEDPRKGMEAVNLQEVLVSMDFTDASMRALESAIPLAQRLGAKIILLHVIDFNLNLPPNGPVNVAKLEQELWREAQIKFDELSPRLIGRGTVFETVIVEGFTHETILEFANSRNVGAIVLGKHPHKFWHLFQRHTAKSVQKKASCLVMVVDENHAII